MSFSGFNKLIEIILIEIILILKNIRNNILQLNKNKEEL